MNPAEAPQPVPGASPPPDARSFPPQSRPSMPVQPPAPGPLASSPRTGCSRALLAQREPVQESGCRHSLFPLQLDLQQLDGSFFASHVQFLSGYMQLSRLEQALSLFRLPYVETLSPQRPIAPRPRVQSSDPVHY